MINSKKIKSCQLCTEEQRQYNHVIFEIDGLTLCYNHVGEYTHSEEYRGTSIHRKKFDKLLNRMEFKEN